MMHNQLNWPKDNFENIETAWEGDLWDRQRLGVQLTNYVDRLQCGAVLALDARWGEGKTWFVRHWAKHLDDTDHNVIYLDAFANDYLEDPFLVIASEIASKLDKTAENKPLVHKFKKAAAVMQQGLLTLAPTLIASMISCALTGGIIPLIKIDSEKITDKLDDAINKVTENIGEKVTEAIQNKIDSYEEEKNSIIAFKQTLAQLAENLDKPLVFIIDELDRCRPDFAIRLIERIKHFFDIPKIVFILVMNRPQLLQSVKNFYGYDSEMNGDYLEKFVDFTVHMTNESDVYDFEEVIKYQLFRIGELNSLNDRNELFYWLLGLQLDKKFNSRELIKKLNKYALLRTGNKSKDLVLLSVVMGVEPYANFYIYINSVVKKLINFLCTNKHELLQKHGLRPAYGKTIDDINDAEWYRIILQNDLGVDSILINQIMNAYDSVRENKDMEFQLYNVLKEVSIYELNHIDDFIKNWTAYVLRGL